MRQRAGKLRFTDDETARAVGDSPVAGTAENAKKLRKKKLVTEKSQKTAKDKLKFKEEKTETTSEGIPLGRKQNAGKVRKATSGAKSVAGTTLRETALTPVRQKLSEGGEDNVGLDAASYAPDAVQAAKTVTDGAAGTVRYGKKLVNNIHVIYQQLRFEFPEAKGFREFLCHFRIDALKGAC